MLWFSSDLPMAPVSVDVTTSHSGTCDVMVEWELPDSTSNTLPVDTVVVEYRACAYDDQSCDLPWQLDNMYPTSVSSSTVSLMVDSVYTFRLAGCSDGNGCGMYTVVEKLVETNVDGKKRDEVCEIPYRGIFFCGTKFLLKWLVLIHSMSKLNLSLSGDCQNSTACFIAYTHVHLHTTYVCRSD